MRRVEQTAVWLSPISLTVRERSRSDNWTLVKDGIRFLVNKPDNLPFAHPGDWKMKVTSFHDTADMEIPNVQICSRYDYNFYASCIFKSEKDAEKLCELINKGYVSFRGNRLKAELHLAGQNGIFLNDWGDQISKGDPPPSPPAPPSLSMSVSQDSRGSLRLPYSPPGRPAHNAVVGRPGQYSNASYDTATSIALTSFLNNVGGRSAHHTSAYVTDLDLDQQCFENFTPSTDNESEMSDSSGVPQHTSKLSASSRTSSVSTIPDAILRSPSYNTFQMALGSPYHSHSSSVSSSSSLSTLSNSRPQSGSCHPLQDTAASDGACKLIIRNVRTGVTSKDLSDLLEKKMARYSYPQYERPQQCEGTNTWTVTFVKEKIAHIAKDRLQGLDFKGWLLRTHVSTPRRNGGGLKTGIHSCRSVTRTNSSSSTISGPTIC